MANLGIGGQNLLALSTPALAGGSWLTALPLANLLTRSRADVARSTNALTTSTKFTIDWGSAKAARAAAILWHNASAAAQWRWARGSTLSGNDVDDSGFVDAWRFTPLSRDGTVYMMVIVRPSQTSARYELFEFSDTGNPAGYLEAARPWIGSVYVPTVNAEFGLQSKLQDLSTKERTEGGTVVAIKRSVLQGETFALRSLPPDEALTLRQTMSWAGTTEEVLYVPDVSDPATQQADGFVGTFDELSPIDYHQFARKGLPVALTRD